MKKYELTDELTELVTGGDYGSSDYDCMSDPKYKVGESVEVYNTIFHRTTRQYTVYEARFDKDANCWRYRIDDSIRHPCNRYDNWVCADDIETKN